MRIKRIHLFVVFLSFLIQLVQASEKIEPTQTLVYKKASGVELKLHLFEPQVASDQKRPAIVYFFGGGWVNGTPKQFYQQSYDMAEIGVVGIAVEYRVMSKHKVTPFESLEDAKSAIRWVRENADKFGIDSGKVIASGGSAGGHLALCTALIQAGDGAEDPRVSSIPNAVVAYNPVTDTTDKDYRVRRIGEGREKEISPVHQIRSGVVPSLIFHGSADSSVSIENVEKFVSLMVKAGNDCELKSYEGREHGFFNSQFFRPQTKSSADYESTQTEVIEFMKRLGFVED